MRGAGWIDITMEFGHPAATYPGDAPFELEWTGRIADGRWGVNLSRICSSPHNGTHSDAPFHVDYRGAKSQALDLEAYLGPCRVVDATKAKGASLPPDLADDVAGVERVLFRQRRKAPKRFEPDFRGLSVDLVQRLAKQGVRLVGTDAPSVDNEAGRGLVAHRALFGAHITIIESLDLSAVKPGDYELVALPLKVSGLCAAPVRAVLRPQPRS